MSGDRQSSFDPNEREPQPQRRPQRPFNAVQWTGLALMVAGIAIELLYFAGRYGMVPKWFDSLTPGITFALAGLALVNARRRTNTDAAPELAAARKPWLLITLTVCTIALGLAILIEFKGA